MGTVYHGDGDFDMFLSRIREFVGGPLVGVFLSRISELENFLVTEATLGKNEYYNS